MRHRDEIEPHAHERTHAIVVRSIHTPRPAPSGPTSRLIACRHLAAATSDSGQLSYSERPALPCHHTNCTGGGV